jgi:hypothetical protein
MMSGEGIVIPPNETVKGCSICLELAMDIITVKRLYKLLLKSNGFEHETNESLKSRKFTVSV